LHLGATPDELQSRLLNAPDGGAAHDAIRELSKLAKDGDGSAQAMLIDYARSGRFDHIRTFITSILARAATARDAPLRRFFTEGLGDPVRGYWSILGYIRIAEANAYRDLVRLLLDTRLPLDHRAHAAKCLARHSGQRFDRGAPSDPGFWSERHIRMAEIRAWLDGGCSAGPGYDEPARHPALDSPETRFEGLVARLDRKLAKSREENQDLAEPTNWLTPAPPHDLEQITERWRLPSVYLDFLTRFSPLRVIIGGSDIFVQDFFLFGAADLIAGQDGYSESSALKRRLEEWPAHLVVIGSDGGDPYVLDLSRSNGEDAPVLTAWHGTGSGEFQPVADSFMEFIELLAE
jgi:SMI1 / KNR4 family (SUKH-1)